MPKPSFQTSLRAPSLVVKPCPWCRGSLIYSPRYPVRLMITGDLHGPGHQDVPEAVRTVAAWVCGTPFCRYREPA